MLVFGFVFSRMVPDFVYFQLLAYVSFKFLAHKGLKAPLHLAYEISLKTLKIGLTRDVKSS